MTVICLAREVTWAKVFCTLDVVEKGTNSTSKAYRCPLCCIKCNFRLMYISYLTRYWEKRKKYKNLHILIYVYSFIWNHVVYKTNGIINQPVKNLILQTLGIYFCLHLRSRILHVLPARLAYAYHMPLGPRKRLTNTPQIVKTRFSVELGD